MTRSIEETVLEMQPEQESILAAAKALLRRLDACNSVDEETITYFYEEVVGTMLDWMGSGETEQVRDLMSGLRKVLLGHAGGLEELSSQDRLVFRLQSLGQVMSTFLRSNNLTRLLGLLSGKRRSAWRKTLGYIYNLGTPVKVGDLVRVGLFDSTQAASHALKEMGRMDLVEKHKRNEGGAVLYSLNWAGHSVCRVLQKTQAEQKIENYLTVSPAVGKGFNDCYLESTGLSRSGLMHRITTAKNRSFCEPRFAALV